MAQLVCLLKNVDLGKGETLRHSEFQKMLPWKWVVWHRSWKQPCLDFVWSREKLLQAFKILLLSSTSLKSCLTWPTSHDRQCQITPALYEVRQQLNPQDLFQNVPLRSNSQKTRSLDLFNLAKSWKQLPYSIRRDMLHHCEGCFPFVKNILQLKSLGPCYSFSYAKFSNANKWL